MNRLARVRYERFEDVDQTNDFVPEDVYASVQLQPAPVVSEYAQIAYPDLVVTKMRETRARADDYRLPDGKTGLALPLPGPERAIWCGFEVAHDTLVAQPAAHDFFSVMPGSGFGVFQIVIDDALVEEWQFLPSALRETPQVDARHLIPLAEHGATGLRQWLDGWFDVRERANSLNGDPLRSSEFRNGLLDRLHSLLRGEDGNARPSLVGAPLERYSLVRQALDLIEVKLDHLSGAHELVEELGVNPRRLQYAFADVLGTSPHRYLLLRKLHAVRRELRGRCRPETTVARAASRYGFRDLGRFSERYRRFFGELPSETLAQGCK